MKSKEFNNHISLKKFYELVFPQVKVYVMRNSGNETEAKDIFQDALLVAWLNMQNGKFKGNDKDFEGYLYQIAKYKWLDQLKSKHKKRTTLKDNLNPIDVAQDLYQETDGKPLLEAVSNLGDTCKKLLQLFYYEKLNLKEIGQILGYNASVIKTKKYRCMVKLREIYLKKYE